MGDKVIEDGSIVLEPMGLAGFPQYIIARLGYIDPNDPRNLGGPEGRQGVFDSVAAIVLVEIKEVL